MRKQEKEQRTATLLTCLGPDALDIYDGFKFSRRIDDDGTVVQDDSRDIDVVLATFEAFCVGETNEIYERYCFNKRDQDNAETVDTYVGALRSLAKTCNYSSLEDSLIRDRIVIGIRDHATQKRLLQESKLTLTTCIDICWAYETTAQQLKAMNPEKEDVHAFGKQVPQGNRSGQETNKLEQNQLPRGQQTSGRGQARGKIATCKFCGQTHEWKKLLCPAWGQKCANCRKKNHFAVKCPAKGNNQQRLYTVETPAAEEEYLLTLDMKEYVNTVGGSAVPKRLYATMCMQNQKVQFQLDCGATVNVLPATTYKQIFSDWDLKNVETYKATLIMFNQTEMSPLGKRRVSMQNPANLCKYNIEFVIVNGNCKPLLGARAIQQMHLISVNQENFAVVDTPDPKSTSEAQDRSPHTQNILTQYQDVFVGEGKLEGKLHLVVDKSVTPVQIPTRKVPVALRDKLKAELERLIELGITKVAEPTDWVSSLVVTMKSNGKVRLCINPKPLNKALKRNHYPLPTLEDILPDLSRAKVFSVVDAKNGFWHIELDEESSYLTTFSSPWGRYRYLRMPFGVSPAPEEFQRRLHNALEGLAGVRAIADDMLVYGEGATIEEATKDHDRRLASLLQRCRERSIKLNKEKLKLRLTSVPYMGQVLTSEGLRPDETKIEAITKMPAPTDKQGVQRLQGMVNYVQRFVPKLSNITVPIRELLRDENEFIWEESIQGTTQGKVKQVLSEAPVLKYFDGELPTLLQCDASEKGLGACLMQSGHPVAYASRSLTTTEQNYAQIEKEMLAIVFGLERFDRYAYGRHVVVESDHKPLEIIM